MNEKEKQTGILDGLYDIAANFDLESLHSLSIPLQKLSNLEERYTQHTLIGEGAIKEIYRCFDESTKRYIAYARPQERVETDYIEPFIHEAWLTAFLCHPNIIKVYEVGVEPSGLPYFTMELKGNRSLKDYLSEKPDQQSKLTVFYKICDALSYAHSRGIVHLDLKPENVQCDRYGEVILCDWGLGRSAHSPVSPHLDLVLPPARNIQGSLGYLAPEQANTNEEPKGTHTDLFSLGCLLYLLLVEEAPFQGERKEILESTQRGVDGISNLTALNQLPRGLRSILKKALSAAPEDRYPSVDALKQDLELFQQGYAPEADAASPLRKCSLFVRRHQVIFGLGSVALALIWSLLLFYSLQREKAERRAEQQKQELTLLATEMQRLTSEHDILEQIILPEGAGEKRIAEMRNDALETLITSWGGREKQSPLNSKVAIDRARVLLEKVLEKDESNPTVRSYLAQIYFISLDFKSFLAIQPDLTTDTSQSLHRIASTYPHFQYSAQKLPPPSDILRVFNQLSEELPDARLLLSKIHQYYYYAYPSGEELNEVTLFTLKTFLAFDGREGNYKIEGRKVYVYANNAMTMPPVLAKRTLVSFLSTATLILDNGGKHTLHLPQLNELTVRTLDVSMIGVLSLERNPKLFTAGEEVKIFGLEHVVLPIKYKEQTHMQTFFQEATTSSGVSFSYR